MFKRFMRWVTAQVWEDEKKDLVNNHKQAALLLKRKVFRLESDLKVTELQLKCLSIEPNNVVLEGTIVGSISEGVASIDSFKLEQHRLQHKMCNDSIAEGEPLYPNKYEDTINTPGGLL